MSESQPAPIDAHVPPAGEPAVEVDDSYESTTDPSPQRAGRLGRFAVIAMSTLPAVLSGDTAQPHEYPEPAPVVIEAGSEYETDLTNVLPEAGEQLEQDENSIWSDIEIFTDREPSPGDWFYLADRYHSSRGEDPSGDAEILESNVRFFANQMVGAVEKTINADPPQHIEIYVPIIDEDGNVPRTVDGAVDLGEHQERIENLIAALTSDEDGLSPVHPDLEPGHFAIVAVPKIPNPEHLDPDDLAALDELAQQQGLNMDAEDIIDNFGGLPPETMAKFITPEVASMVYHLTGNPDEGYFFNVTGGDPSVDQPGA